MPVIFKQNFNAFNQEFDEYFEVLLNSFDAEFCDDVQKFGTKLICYILKIRVNQTELLSDFNEEFLLGETHGAVLVFGQLSLLTAKMLGPTIEEKLNTDYPKFIDTRTNFWRYLVRFIPFFLSELGPPDYTKEFSMATACLLELNYYCIRIRQLELAENFRTFWVAMFLHFFGERFRGRDKGTFLRDLKISEETKAEIKTFQVRVRVEVTNEIKTEGENKSKKSRKKNKKRHK